MSPAHDVLIAGGGVGAVRTAQSLRDGGFEGSIALVCEEERLPYDRPPLSKEYLLGRSSEEDIRLLEADDARERGIELRLGRRLVALDPRARRASDQAGEVYAYDRLVVATGARPHRLPALEGRRNVHYLRTLDDAEALRGALAARPRVGIVGAGFIGLEIASAVRALGCEVTVIEGAVAPLALVLGPEIGNWVRGWHEGHGVRFRCASRVRAAHGAAAVEELELEDGERLPTDVVVVGVGVAPDTGWLAGTGIDLHRGIVCDAEGRSSDPHVFAVGDVACRHADGDCVWSAHWTPASEQAQVVAGALLGREAPAQAHDGYFWSDQYGVKLQFAGTADAAAPVRVTFGSVPERRFVADLGTAGVFAMGCAKEFVRARIGLRRRARVGSVA